MAGLCRVVVQVDLVGLCNNLAVVIMTTSSANVMRALQLAAVRALGWIASDQTVVRPAVVATRARDSILWDSHVQTSVFKRAKSPGFKELGASYARAAQKSNPNA